MAGKGKVYYLIYIVKLSEVTSCVVSDLLTYISLSVSTGGWEPIPELLEAFRTEFALRLFWGQLGAAADRRERYEKFDKILCVLSDKLEPVEITPHTPDPLS